MSKPINSLADAISKLESVTQSKADNLREHIEKDYEGIKSAIDSVRPFFDELKDKAEKEADIAKDQIEKSVKENPWLAIGVIGVVAFFIGLFLGRGRK